MRACGILVVAPFVACAEPPPQPSTVAAPTIEHTPDPPPPVAPALPPEFPADRRCGEPGATPTELPPALGTGRAVIGTAKLHADETATFGTISVKWDSSAWIGNRGTGHRGDAIIMRIDQAEANGGAYGETQEVFPSRKFAPTIGPYRFDLRMSAAPIEVAVEVTKNACPENAMLDAVQLPLSTWISTEATRYRSLDTSSAMLRLGLMTHFTAPRLDISTSSWHRWFEPIPDAPIRVRAGKYLVTFDEIVRGDGDRVHARARIETAPPIPPVARTPGSACGAASSTATTVPPLLDTVPRVIEEQHVTVDNGIAMGSIVMNAKRDETFDSLTLQLAAEPSPSPSIVSFYDGQSTGQVARSGMTMLRIDPSGVDELQVRRLKLDCPSDLRMGAIEAPTHIWLSTIGHTTVLIGAPRGPQLTVQLYENLESPSIGVTGTNGYYSSTITPAIVGDAHALEGVLVEVIDVVGTGGTAFDTKWTTPNTVPAVHVQLRFSPAI